MPQPFYIDSSNQPKLKDCKIYLFQYGLESVDQDLTGE